MHQRFDTLQALRGLACLIVLASHVASIEAQFGLAFSPLRPLLWFGYASVDYFFVMSGFIMALTCQRNFGRPGELPRYLARRFWRIFPIYWIALGIGVGVFVVFSPVPLSQTSWPTELVDTLFLLPLPHHVVQRILPVAWTLCLELVFYTGFAVLFLIPRRLAAPALLAWAAVVLAVAVAGSLPENRFVEHATTPFVLEFVAGSLMALRPVRTTGRAATGAVALGLGWSVVGSVLAFDPDPTRLAVDPVGRVAVFGVPMMVLVFATAAWERTGNRMPWPWLAKIGDASYSIYLIHIPMLIVTLYWTHRVQMSHSRAGHTLWLAVMFAAALLPGLALHYLVEAPLLKMGRRPKPQPVKPPTAETIDAPRMAA